LLIHPKLKATGFTNVPTMVHKGKALNGTSSCMSYIGQNLGLDVILIPHNLTLRMQTLKV